MKRRPFEGFRADCEGGHRATPALWVWTSVTVAWALSGGAPGCLHAQGVEESYALRAPELRQLTLEEALAIGLEDNPDVRASRFRFDATRAGLLEAYGNFLPQLNLSAFLQKTGAGQFLVGGVPFPDPGSYATYYELGVTHRLFDAGRDFFRIGTAHAERRAANAEVALNRLATKREIQRQYVAALAAAALREQSDREIRRRESRLQLAQARFDLGAVTRSDVLQGRIGVSEARVERGTSETTVRTAKLELLRQMGVAAEPDSVLLVDRFEVFEPAWNPDSLVDEALREHPSVLLQRALVEQRESEHWIAKTAYLPSLQAGATFSSSASDTTEFIFRDFEDRSTYSLSLNWELFGGFARYNQTSRANAELRAAREALREAELLVAAGVRQAYLDLLRLYQTQTTRAEDVELAEQQLVLAQERYRIGALSFPDLLDAQVTFTAAETDYIRATYDFFLALADLEEASAQPLFVAGRAASPPPPPERGPGRPEAGGEPDRRMRGVEPGAAPRDSLDRRSPSRETLRGRTGQPEAAAEEEEPGRVPARPPARDPAEAPRGRPAEEPGPPPAGPERDDPTEPRVGAPEAGDAPRDPAPERAAPRGPR